jgi:hypothetical protein
MQDKYGELIGYIEPPKTKLEIDRIQDILNGLEISNKTPLILELHYIRQLYLFALKFESFDRQQFELSNIQSKLKSLKSNLTL